MVIPISIIRGDDGNISKLHRGKYSVNYFDMYSVLFWEDKVFIDGHSYPLGQNATDAINLESETVEELSRTAEEFCAAPDDAKSDCP